MEEKDPENLMFYRETDIKETLSFKNHCASVLAPCLCNLSNLSARLYAQILGMTLPTKEKRRWMFRVRHDMEESAVDSVNFAKSDRIFGEPHWLEVEKMMRSNDQGFGRWISDWGSGILWRLFPGLRRTNNTAGMSIILSSI